jgi:uncharacterized membrane protein YqjE
MNRPPMLMHIRIQNEKSNFGLWLPLFLLIPLALVIFIILSPLILIAILVLWPCGWGRWALLALRAAFVTSWAIRGLKVDVQHRNECLYISVI